MLNFLDAFSTVWPAVILLWVFVFIGHRVERYILDMEGGALFVVFVFLVIWLGLSMYCSILVGRYHPVLVAAHWLSGN